MPKMIANNSCNIALKSNDNKAKIAQIMIVVPIK